jgi:hypothetical protein
MELFDKESKIRDLKPVVSTSMSCSASGDAYITFYLLPSLSLTSITSSLPCSFSKYNNKGVWSLPFLFLKTFSSILHVRLSSPRFPIHGKKSCMLPLPNTRPRQSKRAKAMEHVKSALCCFKNFYTCIYESRLWASLGHIKLLQPLHPWFFLYITTFPFLPKKEEPSFYGPPSFSTSSTQNVQDVCYPPAKSACGTCHVQPGTRHRFCTLKTKKH